VQDKCVLTQINRAAEQGRKAAVKLVECRVDKVAKSPPPLKAPEGTGGIGCSAEVAAKAEALRAAAVSKASSSRPGTSEAQQTYGADASGGSDAAAPANSALVECAVCHRKPGDPGVPATLKLCGGCRITRYCSAECQRKDWKMGHKAVCQSTREAYELSKKRDTSSG
jgi:hypothetical protein